MSVFESLYAEYENTNNVCEFFINMIITELRPDFS